MSTCGVGGRTSLPGDPSNNSILTATPAFGGIDVRWTLPTTNPFAVAYVKVYRGLSGVFVNAIAYGEKGGDGFFDPIEDSNEYFYWIQLISINGTPGNVIGPASAVARPVIDAVIEGLTDRIDSGMLANSLRTDLGRITMNYGELQQEILDRIAQGETLSLAISEAENQNQATLGYIGQEITTRAAGDSALALQLNTVAALNEDTAALVEELSLAMTAADSALGLRIDNIVVGGGGSAEDIAAAVNDVAAAKIGYSALDDGFTTPYDGDGVTIVYPAAAYPAVDYPEYAVNRKRIIDKQGVINWNLTAAGIAKPCIWVVGMPLASAVKQVEVVGPTGGVASLQTAMTAQAGLNGQLTSLYTVKLNVEGLAGGFGLYNTGATVEAGFDVDQFWIGRTQANKKKPFIIVGGETFIDQAVINKITFDKLIASDGSFIVANGKVKADYLDIKGLSVTDAAGNILLNTVTNTFSGNLTGTINGQTASQITTAAATASADAATAINTANTVAGTANTALSTANTASANASAAVSTANGVAGTANSAVATANAAQAAAAAATTAANNASTAAATAAGTAQTAQTNAGTALTKLADIANDSILSPDEKPAIYAEALTILAEKPGISAQAIPYGLVAVESAYTTAYNNLSGYLATLTSPVAWNVYTGNTTVDRVTFNSRFTGYYAARQDLLNAVAAAARTAAVNASAAAATASSNAQTALDVANGVSLQLGNTLKTDSRSVLTGPGGIATGTLNWNSLGQYVSGAGIGITQRGIVGHNGVAETFVIDGTTGNATFRGNLNAAGGSFSGVLTVNAVNAVNTVNISNLAVSDTTYATGSGPSIPTSFVVPAGQVYRFLCTVIQEATLTGTINPSGRQTLSVTANGAVAKSVVLVPSVVNTLDGETTSFEWGYACTSFAFAGDVGAGTWNIVLNGLNNHNKTIVVQLFKK